MILFEFDHPTLSVPELMTRLKEKRILPLATAEGIRFVTHKDVDDEDVERAISAFRDVLS